MLIKTFEIYRDFMITILNIYIYELYVNKSNNANEKAMAIFFKGHELKKSWNFPSKAQKQFLAAVRTPACASSKASRKAWNRGHY